MEYPEHDKLHAIADKSQACGEFFEWLGSNEWTLCEVHSHTNCERDECGFWACGLDKGEYFPVRLSLNKLLAEFFDIDQDKLEAEKLAMLAELRSNS